MLKNAVLKKMFICFDPIVIWPKIYNVHYIMCMSSNYVKNLIPRQALTSTGIYLHFLHFKIYFLLKYSNIQYLNIFEICNTELLKSLLQI